MAAPLAAAAIWIGQNVAIPAGASYLLSLGLNKLRGKQDISVKERDLGNNITDPVASLAVIYGTARIGIHRVFVTTTPAASTDKTYLWIVGALCHGPVAGIDEIYLDGREVFDANGRPQSVTIDGVSHYMASYAHVWKAYGTDGQVTVLESAAGAKTVTATSNVGLGDHKMRITTSAAHGYVVGDIIKEVSAVSGLAAGHGYGVIVVDSSTQFTVEIPEGNAVTDADGGGTVDHYTPDLDTLFGSNWSSEHRGRGVAYIVLRLRFNGDRFPSGLPRVEAVVRGIAAKDPRSVGAVLGVAITSSAVGAAVTGMASTAEITTSAAHGLAVGDIVRIAGHSETELNGTQRVDAVVDSDTFRVHTPLSAAGTLGIIEVLEHSSNPAVCIRDYLTSRVYGPGLTAGYKAPAGTIVVARKSTSAGVGDPPASSILANLGYTVTTDLDATLAECRAFDIVVIDCDAWAADEYNAFIQQLWADGQKVIVCGDDSTTGLFYIATTEAATPVGTAEPGDDADHPIVQGFTSHLDSDNGTRITAVRDFALPLGTYDENAAAIPWVVVAHPSGGCIVHLQTPRIGNATPASEAAIIVNNAIGFLASWASAEVDEAAFSTEANYHDENVTAPTPNGESFTNQRTVVSASGDGTRVTFTTLTSHGYLAADTVRVSGFSEADDLDGEYEVDDVPTSTTFDVVLARNGSWTPELVSVIVLGIRVKARFGRVVRVNEQNRFECHGVVDTTQSVKQNTEDLLTSCRGSLIYQAGTYRLHTKRVQTAVSLVLSEANIVGDWEFAGPSLADVSNVVRATFYDASKNFVVNQVEFPGPSFPNGFLVDDNGVVILRNLDLRFTTNRHMAQQIAMVTRRESRNPITVAVTCHEAALALTVGDVVQVTHETPGWVLKKFWVQAMAILPDGHVRLQLSEYDETAYDLDAQDDDPFAPDTNLNLPSSEDPLPTVVLTPEDDELIWGDNFTIEVGFAAIDNPFYARTDLITFATGEAPVRHIGARAGPVHVIVSGTFASAGGFITPVSVSTSGRDTVGSQVLWPTGP